MHKAAVKSIADKLGIDIYKAAKGIHDIVNENMYGAIRVVSVEKGYDPREFSLLALGGAGPLHANALGQLAGSFPVIIPPTPGVLSALGFLQSSIRNEFSKTYIKTLSETTKEQIIDELTILSNDCKQWLQDEGVTDDQCTIRCEVDVRYFRQGHEIPIEIELVDLQSEGLTILHRIFDDIHEKTYGFKMDTEVEIVNIRSIAIGKVNSPKIPVLEAWNDRCKYGDY